MSLFRSPIWPLAAALAFVTAAAPAMAAGAPPFDAGTAATLTPGQFLWNDAGGVGDIRILVSVPLQRAYVYRGDALVAVSPISTGAPGYDTPAGEYTILEKDADHKSNIYDDAPMPYMLRLTWGGIAIHAGRNPGYPDSHGCVRVPLAFAKKLFAITRLGARVIVTEDYADPLAQDMPVAVAQTVTARLVPLDVARRAAASAIAWASATP